MNLSPRPNTVASSAYKTLGSEFVVEAFSFDNVHNKDIKKYYNKPY